MTNKAYKDRLYFNGHCVRAVHLAYMTVVWTLQLSQEKVTSTDITDFLERSRSATETLRTMERFGLIEDIDPGHSTNWKITEDGKDILLKVL